MADRDLRRLERSAGSGDRTARGQHLLGLVRAGRLSAERLALLAHLGDADAAAALGRPPAVDGAAAWLEDLPRFGPEVLVRGLWLLGHELQGPAAAPVVEQAGAQLLWAVERWLASPSPPRAQAIYRVTRDARPYTPLAVERVAQAAFVAGTRGAEALDGLAASVLEAAAKAEGVDLPAALEAARAQLRAWAGAELEDGGRVGGGPPGAG